MSTYRASFNHPVASRLRRRLRRATVLPLLGAAATLGAALVATAPGCDDQRITPAPLPAGGSGGTGGSGAAGGGGAGPTVPDFDGDGRADLVMLRHADYGWRIRHSSDGSVAEIQWGVTGAAHQPLPPADFDGDGVLDPVVVGRSTFDWYILGSLGNQQIQWGDPADDVPAPADYDGDGAVDVAVFRPTSGEWHVRASGGDEVTTWGGRGDVPVPADYDGDGRADHAFFRPGTAEWHVLGSSAGESVTAWGEIDNFPAPSDVPVPADYDGDGRADRAVLRTSSHTWLVDGSKDGPSEVQLGTTGDLPVVADYDGDGRADVAVYRPDAGAWLISPSGGEPSYEIAFGEAGELPAPYLGVRPPGGPSLDHVGAEQQASTVSYTRKVSIDVDSKSQPHIVTEWNDGTSAAGLYYYRQIDGVWQPPITIGGPDAEVPVIRLDKHDRAWIQSSTVEANGTVYQYDLGFGKCCNATTLVTAASSASASVAWGPVKVNTGFVAALDIDPFQPDHAWQYPGICLVDYDASGVPKRVDDIIFATQGGEKVSLRVSPRAGQAGVIHTAIGGYYAKDSSYTNSTLAQEITWASSSCYPAMGSDHAYVGLGIDLAQPTVAYLAAGYDPGVVLNVFDGTGMRFDPCDLPVVDATVGSYGNGTGRFSPQLAPALGGGTFLCWTSDDGNGPTIQLRTIAADGTMSDILAVGPGSRCAIATDRVGDVHLVYEAGGVRYRKIRTRWF